MRTRTVTETLYKYEELSSSAQEKALSGWQESGDFDGSENTDALKAFEKIFPVDVKDWSYGYRADVNFRMTCDDEVAELSGVRLLAYLYNNYFQDLFKGKYYSLWSKTDVNPHYRNGGHAPYGKLKSRRSKVTFTNDCVLTGVWIDHELLEPIYKFLKQPSPSTTFESLISDCLWSWVYACDKDYESYYSEEYFKDTCDGNDWEFYENGEKA